MYTIYLWNPIMRQMTVASLSSNSSLQTDPSFPSTVTIILPSKLVFPDNVTDSCRTVRQTQLCRYYCSRRSMYNMNNSFHSKQLIMAAIQEMSILVCSKGKPIQYDRVQFKNHWLYRLMMINRIFFTLYWTNEIDQIMQLSWGIWKIEINYKRDNFIVHVIV